MIRPLFSLSPSVFLKKLKTHLFHFSFPPQSHGLEDLWMDISGIDLVLLLHLDHCHLAIIHPHVTTVTHCSCMLVYLIVSENKLSLICLTFTGTLNQFHFTLLFMFTSFRTISYFSSSSRCFLWSILACLTAVMQSSRPESRLEAPY